MPCRQSRDTLVPVSRCPRNKIEWITRADILNCSSFFQTCVVPEKFQYHCVLNENATGFIEVCAPFKTIHGNKRILTPAVSFIDILLFYPRYV